MNFDLIFLIALTIAHLFTIIKLIKSPALPCIAEIVTGISWTLLIIGLFIDEFIPIIAQSNIFRFCFVFNGLFAILFITFSTFVPETVKQKTGLFKHKPKQSLFVSLATLRILQFIDFFYKDSSESEKDNIWNSIRKDTIIYDLIEDFHKNYKSSKSLNEFNKSLQNYLLTNYDISEEKRLEFDEFVEKDNAKSELSSLLKSIDDI